MCDNCTSLYYPKYSPTLFTLPNVQPQPNTFNVYTQQPQPLASVLTQYPYPQTQGSWTRNGLPAPAYYTYNPIHVI